jgi:RNA polymerase sigma factor (sigma-70 family)
MANGDRGAVLDDLVVLFRLGTTASLTDVQLLDCFLAGREEGAEAAFTALVKRHGPMVLRVCRGELKDLHAAEDAFQATFLILASQARSIRDAACLASWLYGVARRVARRARLDQARRAARERRSALMLKGAGRLLPEPPELLPEVQEELDRLPERYRAPIVLCYLEDRTHEEAASQLGIPVGTVKIRLSRGRERLRGRLVRRGLAPAALASALAAQAHAAVPANLLDVTVKTAMAVAALRSATVAALVQGVLRAMLIHKLKTLAAITLASMSLIVTSLVMVSVISSPVRSEQEPQPQGAGPSRPKRDPPSRAKPEPVEEVSVVAVTKARFQRSTNVGATVEPWERVDVLPTASGVLGRLMVDLGSTVKRGDVLAEIEAPELKLDLARSEAALRQARARITTTKAKVEVARSAVTAARADIESAQTELKGAAAQRSYRDKQYQRIQELVKRGNVGARLENEELGRFEAAQAAEAAARSRVAVVQANLANAEAKREAAVAEVDETIEGLRLAELDRERAVLTLGACQVRAPLDGFVTSRHGGVGQFIRSAASGGSAPIVTIAQTREVRVVARVPDNDVPFVNLGEPAAFSPSALRTSFKGKVSRVAGVEDPTAHAMRVEIDLENNDGRLRPGMRGWVEIQLDDHPEGLVIPRQAIRKVGGLSYCYRVIDGQAVRTGVSIAKSEGERMWVVGGLAEGDLVVADASRIPDVPEIKATPGGNPRPSPARQ